MSKPHTITAIDIGTGSVKAIIATPEDSGFRVLGMAENMSSGIRKGVVSDTEKVSKMIANTIEEASRESDCSVGEVYANINGGHIFSTSSRGIVSVSRADQNISQEDVDRVIEAAKAFSLPSNREILEVVPREFVIDKEGGIKDPLGLKGVRLESDIVAISGFARYSKDLKQAILDAGFQVNDLVLGPLASGRAVLTQEEKELGVAVIDIGAATTSLAVFEEGDVLYTCVLPVGMNNLRNDIAIGLQVDIETAELIKNKFGVSVINEKKAKKEKIKTSEGDDISFQRSELRKIVEARMTEVFNEINSELKKISRKANLPAGVVLTGGGANTCGLVDFAKKKMELNCRIGHARRFSPLDDDPSFSVLCGLVLYGFEMEEEEGGVIEMRSLRFLWQKIKKIFRVFIP